MKKRIMALFLALLALTCFVIVACDDGGASDDTSAGSQTIPETEDDRLYPELPDVNYSGDNYTLRFCHWSIDGWNLLNDLDAESEDSTTINDAVYRRNTRIEDKYGIEIEVTYQNYSNIMLTYRNTVAGALDEYDAFFVRSHEIQHLIYDDLFLDLNTLEYVDFDKPWWDSNSIESLSVGGKVYLAQSDITLSDKNSTGCVYFNKQVCEDNKIENIYSLVNNNTWTWDKMAALGKQSTYELNGDSVMNENDHWGIVADDDFVYIMMSAGEGFYAVKDSDDLPVPNFDSPHTTDVAMKIVDMMFDETYFFHNQRKTDKNKDVFGDNQALFFIDSLLRAEGMRGYETDFGIVPAPKFNESQEGYHASVSIHFSAIMSVPKTVTNPERLGILLEALAADSRYSVMPAYYDIVLKEKNTRDDESQEMLDIIFASRVFDLGEYYQFAQFNTKFLRIFSSGSRDVSSLYAANKELVEKAINKFIVEVVQK